MDSTTYNFSRLPAIRPGNNESRVQIVCAASCASLLWKLLLVFFMSSSSLSLGCSSLQSSVESLVTGETPIDETYAGRQHFPVSPEEAVKCLITVAPQEGWEVVSSGYEYRTHGAPGTFFRLKSNKSLGDQPTLSGIFYAEPSGSYVRVSETNGLPEPLVEPLIAEIKRTVAKR